jgi:hypothetical protein
MTLHISTITKKDVKGEHTQSCYRQTSEDILCSTQEVQNSERRYQKGRDRMANPSIRPCQWTEA